MKLLEENISITLFDIIEAIFFSGLSPKTKEINVKKKRQLGPNKT